MKTFTARYWLQLVLLMLVPVYSTSQYTGGTQDGCSVATITKQNSGPAIYYGGTQDGVAFYLKTNTNPTTNIYLGGTDDGASSYTKTNSNPTANIYLGGTQDGVSLAYITGQNSTDTIYRGGKEDGVSSFLKTGQNAIPNIYLGGTQDGVSSNIYTNKNQSPSIYLGGPDDGASVFVAQKQNAFALMIKFSGKWAGNDALLDWDAMAQPGIDNFELERSTDNGIQFTTITRVAAGAGTVGKTSYIHTDVAAHTLPADNVIYRLKAIGTDGTPAYAALVRLDKDKSAPVMMVYPNPNSGRFTLSLANTDNNYDGFVYLVNDAGGKAVQKGNITGANTTFNLSGNAAGTYFLSVFKNSKLVQHFTIVIAH